MSNAEITAYMAGADLAKDAARAVDEFLSTGSLVEMPIPEGAKEAWLRLGDEKFAEWVLRGVMENMP